MHSSVSPYHRHRFPAEIISHSVWLYFRFSLSFRDVEEMFDARRSPQLISSHFRVGKHLCIEPAFTARL